jgi:hypothetical protein
MRRASAACLEARELVAQHEGAEVVCTVEEPPPVSRRGALAGDHHGQRSWVGIGRRQGMMMAAMIVAGLPEPTLVAQGAWAGGLGLAPGKQGDGSHRIREASLLVQGAAVRLHEIDEPRRIDVAEAILQAAYVAGQRLARRTTT